MFTVEESPEYAVNVFVLLTTVMTKPSLFVEIYPPFSYL